MVAIHLSAQLDIDASSVLRVIAQELDMPTLMFKVLYAPNEISNQTIAATLEKYGKIMKEEREMYRDWPNVEPGVKADFQSSHEAPRSSLRVLASN